METRHAIAVRALTLLMNGRIAFRGSISRDILLELAARGGQCELKELMDAIGVSPVAIREHFKRLEAENMLKLMAHPTDGRAKLIELTPEGRNFLREFESDFMRILERCMTLM